MKHCKVQGCSKSPQNLGLCGMHYQRQWRYGTTEWPHETAEPLDIPLEVQTWLAACLDCEGWIGMMRTKRGDKYAYWPAVGVGNTNKRLLLTLRRLTGMGCISLSKRPLPAKDLHMWNVNRREHIDALLQTILPHLILKQKQASLILSLPAKNTRARKERERAWEQLHQLNKKGRH